MISACTQSNMTRQRPGGQGGGKKRDACMLSHKIFTDTNMDRCVRGPKYTHMSANTHTHTYTHTHRERER